MADESANGLKSLDTALGVLIHLSACDEAQSLSEIARACSMPPSKVHRYLASFVNAGLVRQAGRSGRYDLGPMAMQLGLAALARHDFVNETADGMAELTRATGMTSMLSVWSNGGATVVRWQRGLSPTVTSIGLGTTLPLLTSATGRVFLAFAPQDALRKARETELRRAARATSQAPDFTPNASGIETLRNHVRAAGFASVDGRFIPGLFAAAAPILDWQGEAQAVVTLVGTDPTWIMPDAPQVTALIQFCAEHSVQRGDKQSK